MTQVLNAMDPHLHMFETGPLDGPQMKCGCGQPMAAIFAGYSRPSVKVIFHCILESFVLYIAEEIYE